MVMKKRSMSGWVTVIGPPRRICSWKMGTTLPFEARAAKLFGFSILPKMDFGLELLYSQQPMDLQQVTPLPEDNEDLTVLGKVKRHF